MPLVDPYRVLGVKPGAQHAQIHKAYRRLARRYHPDTKLNAPPEEAEVARRRMAALNGAWAILGDPARRAAYDIEAANSLPPPTYMPQSSNGHHFHPPESEEALFDGLDQEDLYEPPRPIDTMVMVPVFLVVAAVTLFVLSNMTGSNRLWTLALFTMPVAGLSFIAAPLLMMRKRR